MASIFPFCALRPAPGSAAEVAAPPYDVVTTDEARALAADNPLSFLRVSRAEIDLPAGTDPYSDLVYERAAENFSDLRRRAPLVEEDAPAFYVYRLELGTHAQTGVAACFSLDEYEHGLICRHEYTRPDKEDDRTRHMLALRAQTGPVFVTYPASAAVDAVVSTVMAAGPLIDFVAPDGVRHAIWIAGASDGTALAAAFAAVPRLYIADGHHRAASAARARGALAGRGPGEHDRLLAVAFPDRDVRILPYNRLVRDLNGLSPEAFVHAVGRDTGVAERSPGHVSRKGEAAMYVAGRWYRLDLGAPDDRAATTPVLDVARLQERVLGPILGIADVRTDRRIEFVGGIGGAAALQSRVDSGGFAVAFALHPVSIRDVMAVADRGGVMPPKSTWFEPKLRDGLLSHLI